MRHRDICLAAAFAFVAAIASAQAPAPAPPQPAGVRALREMFDFLLGQWEGEASGSPGQGAGTFTFETALDGNIVTRRSRTEFPASPDRAAFRHDDLVVIYAEGGQVRAEYADNEGHVIHYGVAFSHESATVTFLSPIAEGQPRYRLTYRPLGKDRVEVAFEMAPPGKPDAFTTYLKGTSRRIK